jgi:hypothetical protein
MPVLNFISRVQVIMRQNMIRSHSMNAVGVKPADFVIAPDVTSFDISEFTRADEMAVMGANTTNARSAQDDAVQAPPESIWVKFHSLGITVPAMDVRSLDDTPA